MKQVLKRIKKVEKKPQKLKGFVQTGTLFIGDAGYMAADPQTYPNGVILPDPSNPFNDWNKFSSTHENDCNLELPGSYNGDLPGRGVVIQTNMLSGSYTVERVEDENGKLQSLWVIFHD